MDRLLIFDLHHDGLARTDIGHRIGEDVGSLLLDQGGLAAGSFCCFVDHLGLDPLFDFTNHDTVADHHLEGVYGAAVGQRIDVNRFDPVLRRIVEDLRDAGARGRARYRDVNVARNPRRLDILLAVAQEKRTDARIGKRRHDREARRRCPAGAGARSRREDRHDRHRRRDDDLGQKILWVRRRDSFSIVASINDH